MTSNDDGHDRAYDQHDHGTCRNKTSTWRVPYDRGICTTKSWVCGEVSVSSCPYSCFVSSSGSSFFRQADQSKQKESDQVRLTGFIKE